MTIHSRMVLKFIAVLSIVLVEEWVSKKEWERMVIIEIIYWGRLDKLRSGRSRHDLAIFLASHPICVSSVCSTGSARLLSRFATCSRGVFLPRLSCFSTCFSTNKLPQLASFASSFGLDELKIHVSCRGNERTLLIIWFNENEKKKKGKRMWFMLNSRSVWDRVRHEWSARALERRPASICTASGLLEVVQERGGA